MKLRLTNSEMGTYRRCPRRWWLGYYRALAPKGKVDFNRPTGIGTRVHNALQVMYDPRQQHIDPLQFLEGTIRADLVEFPVMEADIIKEGELAIAMMEGYVQWIAEEGKDYDLRIIAPEEGVEVPLPPFDPSEVTLMAKLDVRVQNISDDSRWALEHKTVGDLKQPIPLLQIDAQLLTEHLVEYLKLLEEGVDVEEQRADGVLYNMLRKSKRTARAKPPFYDRKEVRHNQEELRNHWRHVVSWATRIQDARERLDAGETHHTVCPPVPEKTCTWQCDFFKICGMLDDGSDVEGAIDDMYTQVDPLARYNETEREDEG